MGESRAKDTKKFDEKNRKKYLTKPAFLYIISHVAEVSNTKARREHSSAGRASALQAGGHRFEPCCSHHQFGPVVQSVSTPACHAGGRRFESVRGRQIRPELCSGLTYASVAQSVEQWTENPRVVGSIPTGGTTVSNRGPKCGCSSSGRAPPCQGGGSEFEPRHPLQNGI